jgi:hypothetical protein
MENLGTAKRERRMEDEVEGGMEDEVGMNE